MGDEKHDEKRRGEFESRIRQLEVQVREQKARLAEQERELERKRKEIDDLKSALARAQQTSQNSSKRPSSDIVKPPSKRRVSGRKIGAQPGHPLHARTPFGPDEVDAFIKHTLACCPECHGALRLCPGVQTTAQQLDIQAPPVRIEEHRAATYWCERCQKYHTAPLPPQVEKGGLCGPYLTALIAYLKGACHASFSTIRKFLRNVAGVRVSRGLLAKIIAKVSAMLEGPYEELLRLLPRQRCLNVDETGHPENGSNLWTWCFRAELFVLFKIDESRGSKVLLDVLGREFDGVLGCDYFSAYRKYMKECDVTVQFCLAHLIRDVKFLLSLPDEQVKAYAGKLLGGLRELFGTIHRREQLDAAVFTFRLEAARARILRAATTNVPERREAQNMAARFRKHGAAYFEFITTPGLEPTNNLAEQAIRFVVIDRLVTQGTRSERGRRWCERIWTVLATCAARSISAFKYILAVVQASFASQKPPSLLAATP